MSGKNTNNLLRQLKKIASVWGCKFFHRKVNQISFEGSEYLGVGNIALLSTPSIIRIVYTDNISDELLMCIFFHELGHKFVHNFLCLRSKELGPVSTEKWADKYGYMLCISYYPKSAPNWNRFYTKNIKQTHIIKSYFEVDKFISKHIPI